MQQPTHDEHGPPSEPRASIIGEGSGRRPGGPSSARKTPPPPGSRRATVGASARFGPSSDRAEARDGLPRKSIDGREKGDGEGGDFEVDSSSRSEARRPRRVTVASTSSARHFSDGLPLKKGEGAREDGEGKGGFYRSRSRRSAPASASGSSSRSRRSTVESACSSASTVVVRHSSDPGAIRRNVPRNIPDGGEGTEEEKAEERAEGDDAYDNEIESAASRAANGSDASYTSLRDEDYEKFINRKISAQRGIKTYTERRCEEQKRRESEEDCDDSLSSLGESSQLSTDFSNARRLKIGEANNHERNADDERSDNGRSVSVSEELMSPAERLKQQGERRQRPQRERQQSLPHRNSQGQLSSPHRRQLSLPPPEQSAEQNGDQNGEQTLTDEEGEQVPEGEREQMLVAEVRVSSQQNLGQGGEGQSFFRVGENEDLTDEEERMIAAIDACWRNGEEARREIESDTSSSSEEEENEQSSRRGRRRSSRMSWSNFRPRTVMAMLVEDQPVEAIPVDENGFDNSGGNDNYNSDYEANEIRQRMPSKRQLLLVYIPVLIIVVALALIVGLSFRRMMMNQNSIGEADIYTKQSSSEEERHGPTLVKVLKEGVLRCGVPESKQGLSTYNPAADRMEGMSVDLCRAVATRILGGLGKRSKSEYEVELINVTSVTRFVKLAEREIDFLIYGDTHTMERDFHEKATGLGFQFSDPYLYDGLGFAGVPRAVQCADDNDWLGECSDLSICVMAGSTHKDILSHIFPRQRLISTVNREDYLRAFANGTCLVIAGEQNQVTRMGGNQENYAYGRKKLSKEPLAMVTRKDDQSWSDLCNWILRALVHAERMNITQNNAREMLPPDLPFVAVLEEVGNYGEIWARHLEAVVPRLGLNMLYIAGEENTSGLHYSHPFGVIDRFKHEFLPSGTINRIVERGKLICGIFDSDVGQSIDADFCRSLAASLFDSDASLVDFVELSKESNFIIKVNNGEVDVVAGATLNFSSDLAPSNETESGMTGLAFSQPYFYGEDGAAPRALTTSQLDPDWSTYVYWVVAGIIWAEENGISSQNDYQLVPEVASFGPRFEWMFKGCILGVGNYAEIYTRDIDSLPPRANYNLLNDGSSPQLFPPPIDVLVFE